MADVDLGTAKGKIEIDSSGAKRGIDQFESDLAGSTERSKGNIQALNLALVGIGAAAVGGFAFAITKAADFEQTMSGVKAVSGATADQMEALRKKALKLGADTVFSAQDAAGAMEELVKAGLSVDDVLNGAADAAVNLAAAGGISIPDAARIASNAMNEFSLSAEQLPHVADLIAGAANASAIDVGEFGMSLSQAGATANLIGLNFDDLAVAIAAMGNAGIRGSDAGTSIKTFLQNLQPVTKKQIDLFADLGLSQEALITQANPLGNAFFDSTGSIKSMSEIADVLNKSLVGMSDAQKTATLEALFGTDAIRAAAVVANEGAEGIDALAASMGEMTAADVAATRLDNTKGSLEQLKGSLETAAIDIGTRFLPAIKDVLDHATDWVNKFSDMDEKTQNFALAAVGGTAAAAGLVGGIGLAAHVAGPAVAGIGQIASSLGSLIPLLFSNPWVLFAAVVAAVVVGIVLAYKRFEAFREIVDGVVDAVVNFAKSVAKWFMETALPALKEFARFFMEEILPRIRSFIEGAVTLFGKIVSFFTETLIPGVQSAFDTVMNVIGAFITWFNDNVVSTLNAAVELILAIFGRIEQFVRTFIVPQLEFLFALLAPIVSSVFSAIGMIIETVFNTIKGIFEVFINFVQKAWALFGDNILSAIELVFNTIKLVIETALGIIRGILQVLTGIITLDWDKTWEGIKTIFTSVWDFIKGYIQITLDAIKLIIETVIDTIKLILSTAWDVIKLAASTAWEGIKLAIMVPLDLLKGLIQGVWDAIKSAADTAWGLLKGAASEVWEKISAAILLPINIVKDLIGEVWDTMKSVAGTAWNAIKDAIKKPVDIIIGIIQGVIDKAKDAIGLLDKIPGVGAAKSVFGFVTDHLAAGGIVARQTIAMIGEAGPEVVIPMTDPTRALELMRQSGLDVLAAASVTAGGTTSTTGGAQVQTNSPGEVVHIDHAEFYDSVDVEMLLTQAEFALQGGKF